MFNKSNNKKIKIVISFLLVTFLLMHPLGQLNYLFVSAALSTDTWVILDGKDTQFTKSSIEGDDIIQILVHHARSNENRYETENNFYMTLDKYDTDKDMDNIRNSVIQKSPIFRTKHDDPPDGDKVTTTYTMKRQAFITAATQLGVTANDILNAPGDKLLVYLNTAFNVFRGDEFLGNFYGTQEILSAGEHFFGGWSGDTQERIPYFYNMPYYITASNIYDINVIAIDTNKNNIKTFEPAKNEKHAIYNQKYNYTLPEKKFTIAGNEYTFTNVWWFKYRDRATGETLKTDRYTVSPNATKITREKMPDADQTLTIYLEYKFDTTTITPTPKPPTPTPKPGVPTPTSKPNPTPTLIPSSSTSLPFTQIDNSAVIQADNRGSEKFEAVLGVPTTESLYGEVSAKGYLLGYTFVKKTGRKNYSIKVTKDYILNWKSATPTSAGGGKAQTQTVTITQTITVMRQYAYWEIENLECYRIGSATLNNYALPNGSSTIYPNYSYYNPPSVSVQHSGIESDHILDPPEVAGGINLGSQTVAGGTTKPNIPIEDFTSKAEAMTGKIRVQSDLLIFNGTVVMNSSVTEVEAPDINTAAIPQCDTLINNKVLYKPNQVINAVKENGHYGSTGSITYTSIASVNPTRPDSVTYPISGINKVVIHTPVLCKPSIAADNDKYVQLINPTQGCVELVLDPDQNLSDFIVNISNNGPHSNKLGYYTRDFSKSLRDPDISYIASKGGILRNEVKFPFDVYVDVGNDKKTDNDDYLKADTWMTIGRFAPRFYLPMWTEEGVYTVNFRTVAVNGEPYLNKTEKSKNTDLINYIATETMKVEVSGRIYGLTIYDLSDYPIWQEVFRIPNSTKLKKNDSHYIDGTKRNSYSKDYAYTYTLGTNDQYGNDTGRKLKYTFPLVNGSHPKFNNIGILKTGYMTRFSLETTGNMFDDGSTVSITPAFYYVDEKGKNRKGVDLYYTEEIYGKSRHLVKVGGAMDLTNLKTYTTGDLYLNIPEEELRQTAKLRKTPYGQYLFHKEVMFGFAKIRLNSAFRTYVNEDYTANVKKLDTYADVKDRGVKEDNITMRKQRWYGQYYIPNEVHVVSKGFDVMDYADKYGVDYSEDFWLNDGYIIVNFNIETVENGKERLSYINATNYRDNGNCSMWILEGPPLSKTDNEGVEFNFYAGDYIIYYSGKRASQDYTGGAIY